MLVLGIETTCDETAAALVYDGKKILSHVIYSQIPFHQPFGGVFPELASRHHVVDLPIVIQKTVESAQIDFSQIDLISVAKGPGLIGSLLVGINGAKALAWALQKPLLGVNHVEAHLYAAMMPCPNPLFPAIGLVVSGGHTFLVHIETPGIYHKIGGTVDDAVGEAFDKVAKLLYLPYPGGPEIEKLARHGNPNAYAFKTGWVKDRPYHFSFSGLKTNVFYTVHGQNGKLPKEDNIPLEKKADIAASFQEAALQDITHKTAQACKQANIQALYVGGGVSHNERLRTLLQQNLPDIPLFFPPPGLSADNGAMIAGLGGYQYLKTGASDLLSLRPSPRLPLW